MGFSIVTPHCDKACHMHTAKFIQLFIVCNMYWQLATKTGRGPGNKTTHLVLNVNQNPSCLWSMLRSDPRALYFCCSVCLTYVAAMCTKLRRNLRSLKFCSLKICWEACPEITIMHAVCSSWPHHLEIACYSPVGFYDKSV